MTLDKTLQRIIQRAEFKGLKHTSADYEHRRLMPIIQGLCEEVQRKQNCIDGFMKLLEDNILVRNTENDHDFRKYFEQGARLMGHLTACEATSALEKLGGEDE